MATEAQLKALRAIGQRLNELTLKSTGKPILSVSTAGLSLEELVFLIEEASEKIPSRSERGLEGVIRRLKAVEETLAGSSLPFQSQTLEQKVLAIENIATSLEIKLNGKSSHSIVSQQQPEEVKKEEPKKEEPKKEEPKKEEPKKEEPKEPEVEVHKDEKPQEKIQKAPSDTIFSGELEKIGKGMLKKWQKRMFYLTKTDLEWFSSHDGTLRNKLPLGDIAKVEAGPEGKHKKPWVIELETRKKVYHLAAPDEQTFGSWIKHLSEAVQKK